MCYTFKFWNEEKSNKFKALLRKWGFEFKPKGRDVELLLSPITRDWVLAEYQHIV